MRWPDGYATNNHAHIHSDINVIYIMTKIYLTSRDKMHI